MGELKEKKKILLWVEEGQRKRKECKKDNLRTGSNKESGRTLEEREGGMKQW